MPGGEQLLDGDLAGAPAERLDAGDGLVNLFPPAIHFRYQAGNRPAMARDDDDLAALDVIKQLQQMSFGLRSLNLAYACRRFDQFL